MPYDEGHELEALITRLVTISPFCVVRPLSARVRSRLINAVLLTLWVCHSLSPVGRLAALMRTRAVSALSSTAVISHQQTRCCKP